MKKAVLLLTLVFCVSPHSISQIFEPEGINMPGTWDSFTNPPSIAALRSSTISSGNITKISTGNIRWQTTIKVAASGGDFTGGSYSWLFTSGPDGGRFNNKWAGTSVTLNTIQSYTFNTGSDNSITVTNGKWYTVNWEDNGYTGTNAIFMETTGEPVTISTVSDNYSSAGVAVDVSITSSATPASEEKIFVRYTTDGWSTSSFVQATGSGTSWSATIPSGGVTGTANNQYYVLTTTISSPTHADADMQSIKINNNGGSNFTLPVELTSFTATPKTHGVDLAWSTATELNNHGFEVERRVASDRHLDGDGHFARIGFVAGAGNSNAPKTYSFFDATASGSVSYRLKQVDNDGKFEYSNIVEVIVSAPVEFALMQNHPNPFNPTTSIRYRVAGSGLVSLKVYDMLGKEVAILANGMQDAGEKSIQFDASQLPSGMYFYTLRTNTYSTTKKMLLIK